MRIAIFQGPEQAKTPQQALNLLARVAADAAGRGARLLICPEMYLTGYNIGPDAARRLAETPDGSSAQAIMRIARDTGIAILYGYPERGASGRIYNAVQLIDRTGHIAAAYRKTHLFGEIDRTAFAPGTAEPQITELEGLKVGILICYDVEFPENVRALALKGADLVAVPTALMQPADIVARTVVPARAFENQVFLAYADRCGVEGELTYCGLSCVVAPDGTDLARAGRSEGLIIADLDLEHLKQSRQHNTYVADRRPELYGALTERAQTIHTKDA